MGTDEKLEIEEPKPSFTKKKFLIIFFLSVACLTEGSCFSCIAPFYAEEVI